MPENVVSGRVASVAGATRGIGRAIALGQARAGVDILGVARGVTRLTGLGDEISALSQNKWSRRALLGRSGLIQEC